MSDKPHKWFIEYSSPGTAHMIAVENYIKNFKTSYQQVEIADTLLYGRILILDGKIQSSALDEYIYHEALVHPAMLMCPEPRRVLVLGGGEGATLREVFKHPTVESLVMVDLDREVVENCMEYLGNWHRGSFEDPRLELIYMDAREYLENGPGLFDVIISDVPEPVEEGPALKLFTRQYFALIKDHLVENGVFALQAGDFSLPFIEAHSAINNTIKKEIASVHPYRAFVPSFNSEWSFILASPGEAKLPSPGHFNRLIEERKLELKYFDGETAAGIFSIPVDIRRRLSEETRIIDDRNLLTIY